MEVYFKGIIVLDSFGIAIYSVLFIGCGASSGDGLILLSQQ